MFWHNWTYMVVIGKKLQTNEKLKRWLQNSNRNFNETIEPRSVLTSQTRPAMKNWHCQANNIPKIWLSNGSVNSKRAHPPWAFVILFLKSRKCPKVRQGIHTKTPRWGLKIGCKCPTPGQHQNCIFQSISCKYHIYGKFLIIWSKRVKRPTQIAPARQL